jgi:hypothetical protein
MQINARWVAEAFLSSSSIANKWLALISDIIKN